MRDTAAMLDHADICAAGTWSAVRELADRVDWANRQQDPLAAAWLAPRLGAPRAGLRAALRLTGQAAGSSADQPPSDRHLLPAAAGLLRTRGSAAVLAQFGDQPDPATTPDLAAVIGLALANLGDRSSGREMILAAIRHAPESPVPVRARARLEELVGERRRALRLAGEALELAPMCPESRALRARLLGESGRRDDARQLLDRVPIEDELDLLLVWRAALADADNDHAMVAQCAAIAVERPYLESPRRAWWQRRAQAAEAPVTARPRRVRLSLPRARGPLESSLLEALVRFWGKSPKPSAAVLVDAPWLPLASVRSRCAAAGMRSVTGFCDPQRIPDWLDRGLPVVLGGLPGRYPVQVVVGCEPATGELLVRPVHRRWATPLAPAAIGADVVALVAVPERRERMLSHVQLAGSQSFDAAFAAVMALADEDPEGAEEMLDVAASDPAGASIIALARQHLGLGSATTNALTNASLASGLIRAGSGDRSTGLAQRARAAHRRGDRAAAWQWWRRAAHADASEPTARQAWLAAWRAGERAAGWQWLVQRCAGLPCPSAGLGTLAWAWLIGGEEADAESLCQAMLVHVDRVPDDKLMPALAERWWPWIPGLEPKHVPDGSEWRGVRQAMGAEPPAPGRSSRPPPPLPPSELTRLPWALARARAWLDGDTRGAWCAAWAVSPGDATVAAALTAAATQHSDDGVLDRVALHRCLCNRDDAQAANVLRSRIMARPQAWEPRWRAWAMAPLAAMGSLNPDPSLTAEGVAPAAAPALALAQQGALEPDQPEQPQQQDEPEPPGENGQPAAPPAAFPPLADALAWAADGPSLQPDSIDEAGAAGPAAALSAGADPSRDQRQASSEERPVPRDLRQALLRGDGDAAIAAAVHCLTAGDTPASLISAVIEVCQQAGFRSALRAHLRTVPHLSPAVAAALDLDR